MLPHILVLQIDLVPTISLLFGLGVPRNNLGVIIEETLKFVTGILGESISVRLILEMKTLSMDSEIMGCNCCHY